MNDGLKKTGIITVEHRRNGELINSFTIKNIITTVGKAEFAKLAGLGLGGTAFSYIALGTGTTAVLVGDTTLEGEIVDTGLQRTSATVTNVTTATTNDTTRLSKTFTATGAKTIGKVGIFNASSVGVLGAEQTFASPVTVGNTDTISITYDVINS